jgi:site-specific DNA recombinase
VTAAGSAAPRLALYCRKSKIVREGAESLSIQTQEARGRAWAAANGYEVVHVFPDNLSAWSDVERPEFDKAIAALERGEIDAVWNFALDRFSRKGAGAVIPLMDAGRRLIFDYEGLDSANPQHRLLIIVFAENALAFSDRLSHNARTTKARTRNLGAWSGRAPYGFELRGPKGNRRLHIRPREWATVERIYALAAEGASTHGIARTLNDARVPGPAGGDWNASAIQRILVNPVYEGWQIRKDGRGGYAIHRDATGNRVRVLPEGEGIPADVAANARASLRGNLIPARKAVKSPGRAAAILAGLLRCQGCGGALTGGSPSYHCYRHMNGQECPSPTSVRRTLLEHYVTEAFLTRLGALDPEDDDDAVLLTVVAERWATLTAESSDAASAREAIAARDAAREALARLMADRQGGLWDGLDREFRAAHREARAALATAQERVDSHGADTSAVGAFLVWSGGELRRAWDAGDPAEQRALLRLAVDAVHVSRGKRGAPFDGHARVRIEWAGDADA